MAGQADKNGNFNLAYRGKAGEGRVGVTMWAESWQLPTNQGGDVKGNSGKVLRFWVNPAECQWSVATRTFIEKIQGGAIHHEWDSVGIGATTASKFDQPMLNLAFQSGLILPNGTLEPKDRLDGQDLEDDVAPGLGNFYDFLHLLSQQTVLENGNPNYVNIAYVSSVFPSMLLKGFFTPEGVQWRDTADNPYMINGWGASFMVFQSYPDLADATALRSQFIRSYFQGSAVGSLGSNAELGQALGNIFGGG